MGEGFWGLNQGEGDETAPFWLIARITGSVPAGGDPAQAFERFARTSPDRAARVILAGVAAGKPRILVGPDAYLIEAAARVLGHRYQRLVSRVGRRLTA